MGAKALICRTLIEIRAQITPARDGHALSSMDKDFQFQVRNVFSNVSNTSAIEFSGQIYSFDSMVLPEMN
jgi:hypothetical protein